VQGATDVNSIDVHNYISFKHKSGIIAH